MIINSSFARDIVAHNRASIKDFADNVNNNANKGISSFEYSLPLDEWDLNYLRGLGYVIVVKTGDNPRYTVTI